MAQARPLSNVGSRTSFFAAFHSLAAAHTSNRLNHALASPSSKGSGKHIVFPVAIVPGFRHHCNSSKEQPRKQSQLSYHKVKGRTRVRSRDTLHAYTINYLSYYIRYVYNYTDTFKTYVRSLVGILLVV